MKILQSVKKIPGGLMVIPLFLGAAFNTFLPGLITLGGSGTFTSHLWKSGAMPILAVFLFCNGAQINVKQAGVPVVKGIIITAVKVGLGAIVGILLNMAFGPAGILGLTPLAVIAAMANSNGGLYAALAGEFGDATDVGAVSILSINDGPFFTMVALGASGIASIPFMTLVGCVMPIVVGCVLGNMDAELRRPRRHHADSLLCVPARRGPQLQTAHHRGPARHPARRCGHGDHRLRRLLLDEADAFEASAGWRRHRNHRRQRGGNSCGGCGCRSLDAADL